jgi:cellulose synthase/poly-beta-1,6-N-acetylglucosamine synthase-like glycosyltransferase
MKVSAGWLKSSGRRWPPPETDGTLGSNRFLQCLRAISAVRCSQLMAAAKATEHEIIVVDNDSSDGSPGMVSQEFPSVKLIVSDSNEGFASACNRGIQASSGEYVLILNPDTVTSPDAITRALDFMKTHPDAGAAGAHMTDGNGRFLPESKRGFPSPLTAYSNLPAYGGSFRVLPYSMPTTWEISLRTKPAVQTSSPVLSCSSGGKPSIRQVCLTPPSSCTVRTLTSAGV